MPSEENPAPPKEWLTAKEAAERMGISRSALQRLIVRWKISHYRVTSRSIRLKVRDVDAYIRSRLPPKEGDHP